MNIERATLFGRSITPPTWLKSTEHSRREAMLRKWERNIRNDRINELNGLIHRHFGDKNYAASVAAWRREKLDLLARF